MMEIGRRGDLALSILFTFGTSCKILFVRKSRTLLVKGV